MDYDFQTDSSTLRIPAASYQPVKRCPICQSVFISEKSCEACGRSMLYHPVGEAFGPKSFYGIKERYVDSLHALQRLYPQFENLKSSKAQSYVRKQSKRFSDLIAAFNTPGLIEAKDRRLFYVESMELIDELLRYEIPPSMIQTLLEDNDSSQVGFELLHYLQNSNQLLKPQKPWKENFLSYRLWGLMRVDSFIKVSLIAATVVTMAVKYKEIISSQFGR